MSVFRSIGIFNKTIHPQVLLKNSKKALNGLNKQVSTTEFSFNIDSIAEYILHKNCWLDKSERFPDLTELPPELGLFVLSHLDATDLCLAGCVWNELACDEVLWMG